MNEQFPFSSALTYYLLVVNMITFIVYGVDKWKAGHGKWRISEFTLLLLAIIGGSMGAWLGMHIWRHKTKHLKFRIGVSLIFFVELALSCWAFGLI